MRQYQDSNMCIAGIPEEEKENEAEIYLKKKWQRVPKFGEIYKFIDSRSSETINRIHTRKPHPGIPQSKLITKDKILKSA